MLFPVVKVLLHVETVLLGKLKPSTVQLEMREGLDCFKVGDDKKV